MTVRETQSGLFQRSVLLISLPTGGLQVTTHKRNLLYFGLLMAMAIVDKVQPPHGFEMP